MANNKLSIDLSAEPTQLSHWSLSIQRWLARLSRWRLVSRRSAAQKLIEALQTEHRTMVSDRRMWNLFDACVSPNLPDGAFVECGVAQGGCVALMSLMARGARPVWGFDSFEEMPPLQAEDEGDGQAWVGFRCSGPDGLQRARQTLNRYAVDRPTVRLIPGWFEDTLPAYLEQLMPIAVLRLDNDWYKSTRYCLENLYGLVAPGGFVLIDDYHTFVGCRKAVDNFRMKRGIDGPLITVESGSEAYWRKP